MEKMEEYGKLLVQKVGKRFEEFKDDVEREEQRLKVELGIKSTNEADVDVPVQTAKQAIKKI